jgi:hypothetical protein
MVRAWTYLIGCLALAAAPTKGEARGGSYVCRYHGDWACGGGEICIDTSRYAAKLRYVLLTVDLDRNIVSLNGISGEIARNPSGQPEQIKWGLPAFGRTKFAFRVANPFTVALLTSPDGGYQSEFLCNAKPE